MSVGKRVRALAGPFEPLLTDAYRRIFFDVDAFARRLCASRRFSRVVEVGCGEGALLSALSLHAPSAHLTGIDISPGAGRLFSGDAARTEFIVGDAAEHARSNPASADLVIVCDVMHHIAPGQRAEVWRAIASIAAPEATIVIKEWIRSPWSAAYWLGHASDRFITGDIVEYRTAVQWIDEMSAALPDWEIDETLRLSPWRVNQAFMLKRRRPAGEGAGTR